MRDVLSRALLVLAGSGASVMYCLLIAAIAHVVLSL
jgi:hypothetical protein